MAVTPESPAVPHAEFVPGLDQDQNAAADAHAYQRGSMAINEQVATFDLFTALTKWGSLWIAAVIAAATVATMPGGNLFAGLLVGVVLLVAGYVFLKKPKGH